MPSTILTRAQDIKRNKAFIYAAADGENDKIRQLLEAKVSVDVQDSRGKTALMWAAENLHADTVSLLLEAKASIDLQDHFGETALFQTVWFKRIDSVRQLLDAKASVEIETNKKMTALDKTTQRISETEDDYIPIINMLLAPNVNATVRDHSALYDFLTLFKLEKNTLPALMALYKQVCSFINHHPNPLSDEKFDSLQRIYNYGMLTEKNVQGLPKPFFYHEEHTHKDSCCSHLIKSRKCCKKNEARLNSNNAAHFEKILLATGRIYIFNLLFRVNFHSPTISLILRSFSSTTIRCPPFFLYFNATSIKASDLLNKSLLVKWFS